MPKAKNPLGEVKLTPDKIQYLKQRMAHLVERNYSWGLSQTDYGALYPYLAVQKITYLYDDELFEGLEFVDQKKTVKVGELDLAGGCSLVGQEGRKRFLCRFPIKPNQ